MALQVSISDLRRAGFNDELIMNHVNDMRGSLLDAGFSHKQINDYYGLIETEKSIDPIQTNDIDTVKITNQKENEDNELNQNITVSEEEKLSGEDLLLDTEAKKIETNTEEIADAPIEDVKLFDHSQEAYEKTKGATELKNFLDKREEQKRTGEISLQDLDDKQLDEYYKNGGNLVIDGKTVNVIKEGPEQIVGPLGTKTAKTKIEILNTFDTTLQFSKLSLLKAQNDRGYDDRQIINLNEGLSFVAKIESNNINQRSSDNTKGGLYQIKDSEVATLLNKIGNRFSEIDPNWNPPEYFTQGYKHSSAEKLPIDLQRAMAIEKMIGNPEAEAILEQAVNGDKQAWIDLYNITYNPDDLETEETQIRLNEIFDSFGTTNYKYVNGTKAFFADRDDKSWAGWVTKKLMQTNSGKTLVRNLGGEGHINVFGTGGGNLGFNGLKKMWQTEIDENGFSPQEAYMNVFMLQNHNFSSDLIAEMSNFINGDYKPFLSGMLGGLAVGGTVTAATKGFGVVLLPAFVFGGGYAATETLRTQYTNMILNNEVNNADEYWSTIISGETAKEFGKNFVVGGGSVATGSYLYKQGFKKSAIAGEIGSYVGLQALLSGQMPSKEEFASIAAMTFGFIGAAKGYQKMIYAYKKYGIKPAHFYRMSQDPNFKEDVLNLDKMDLDIPDDINNQLIEIAEQHTDTKLLPNPKHELNSVIETSASGTEKGKIIDRQSNDQNEIVLKVENDGDIIYVKESDVNVALKEDQYDVVLGDEIRLTEKYLTDFDIRKSNNEFNNDIIQYKRKEELDIPFFKIQQLTDKIEAEIVDFGVTKQNISTTNISGTTNLFVNKKIYPDIAKKIDANTTNKKTFNTKKEFISKNFKGINNKKALVADEVFAIEKGGMSKYNYDAIVLRAGNEYFTIPLFIYESLKTTTNAKPSFKYVNNILVVTDNLNNQIIAAVRTKKVKGNLKYQSMTYYNNFLTNSEKFYTSTSPYNNLSTFVKVPDEPISSTADMSTIPNMPQFNPHANMLYNSAKGLSTFDLVELSKAILENPIILANSKGGYYGVFRSLVDRAGQLTNEAKRDFMNIELNRQIQINPKVFTSVLAHEIGHAIDYIGPEYTMQRGNLLGKLAVLKSFLNNFIDENGQPSSGLTRSEILEIKKNAEKLASLEFTRNKEVLSKEFGITPEILRKIYNDANIRSLIDPDIYDALVKLSVPLRVQIGKDAIADMVNPFVEKLIQRAKGIKPKYLNDEDFLKRANEIFVKNVEKAVKEKGLVRAEDVRKELIRLTETWHPYDKTKSSRGYVRYRESGNELMAEFMMSFLLRPQWTISHAPKSTDLFLKYMDRKPEVKEAYYSIQADINSRAATGGSTLVANKIIHHFIKAEKQMAIAQANIWQSPTTLSTRRAFTNQFALDYIDTSAWMYKRGYQLNKNYRAIDSETGKYIGGRTINTNFLNAINSIEKYAYKNSITNYYTDQVMNKVFRPLSNLDTTHNRHSLSVMLLLKNLALSTQRSGVANPFGLWADLESIVKLPKDLKAEPARQGGTILTRKDISEYINEGRTPYDLYNDYRKLHPELDELGNRFHQLRDEIMTKLMIESKAFSKTELDEMRTNYSYITYNPLDKAIKNLENTSGQSMATLSFKGTKGTITDMVNPLDATIEKDIVLINHLTHNAAVANTVNALRINKTELETIDSKIMAKKGYPEWRDRIIIESDKNRKPFRDQKHAKLAYERSETKGMELVSYRENGKNVHVWINEGAYAAVKRDPYHANANYYILNSSMQAYRYIWTEISPVFWVNQTFQDVLSTYKNIKGMKMLGKHSFIKYVFKNIPRSYRFARGKYDEVTQEIATQGWILGAMDGHRGNKGIKALTDLRRKGHLTEEQYDVEMFLQKMKPEDYRNQHKEIRGFFQRVHEISWTAERLVKIAGYDYVRDAIQRGDITLTPDELAFMVREKAGAPKMAVKARNNKLNSGVFTFFNAILRGYEATYRAIRENPVDYLTKQSYIMGFKGVNILMGLGAFGLTYKMYASSVTDYDDENFIWIPLGDFVDDKNKKNIKYGRLVYIRLPLDPASRFTYSALNTMVKEGTKHFADQPLKREDKNVVQRFFSLLDTDIYPTINPILKAVKDISVYLAGQNPYDDWTKTGVIDRQTFELDKKESAIEMTRYLYNNYATGNLYRFDPPDETEVLSELERVLDLPVGQWGGKYIRVGSYPTAGEFAEIDAEFDDFISEHKLNKRNAIRKLIKGEPDTITDTELASFEIISPDLFNNRGIIQELAKENGGGDFLYELISETNPAKYHAKWNTYIENYAKDPDRARELRDLFD